MFLVLEGGNVHDINLLRDRPALMLHLHARMIAGVDVDSEIDVYIVDLASRIVTSANIVLHEVT